MSEQTKKERVLEALKLNGQKTVPELAKTLGISASTVKYSLLVLFKEGKVHEIRKSTRVILWEAVKEE